MTKHNRRDFFKLTSLALAGSVLPGSAAKAQERILKAAGGLAPNQKIRIGLVGCGGRGTGAANQAMNADPNVELVAMADIFDDQIESSLESLRQVHSDKINVPQERKFVGFDSYQKLMNEDLDVVLLASPPAFRPVHIEAAVDKGVHIFCEKPVAVDARGYHKVIDAVDIATRKNLNIVSGFCWRYHEPKRAFFDRVLDGAVGDIRAVYTTYNTGAQRFEEREAGWTDEEFVLRNWLYHTWLSGDHLVEQAVHSLDFMSWALGEDTPASVMATGGRQVRTEDQYGYIFDHFALTYEYDSGVKGFHMARQQANCENSYKAEIYGSNGVGIADVNRGAHRIDGRRTWEYDGEWNNMYQTQHDELFAAIRTGQVINDGYNMAKSSMVAIMGRMAAYTGQRVTWEEAINSDEVLIPDSIAWGEIPNSGVVALPGITRLT